MRALRILRADNPILPTEDLHLNFESVDFIKDVLRDVVVGKKGTGRAANSRYVQIGGKTGTSQVVSQKNVKHEDLPAHLRDHAWFIAFAPVDEPEIAMAVFVENGGHGGSAAAPIARRAIEAYLAKEQVKQNKARKQPKKSSEQPVKVQQEPRAWRDLVTNPEILNSIAPVNTPTPVAPEAVISAPVSPALVAPTPVSLAPAEPVEMSPTPVLNVPVAPVAEEEEAF